MLSVIRSKPVAALIALLLGALGAQVVLAQPAPADMPDWRFADPAASMIGGLDVHAVLQSPLVKSSIAQANAKSGAAGPAIDIALNMLNGVSRLYFSVSGHQQNASTLVLMKGSLSDASANALLQGAAMASAAAANPGNTPQSGAKPGTKPGSSPPFELRRVDPETLLFGDPALLDAAMRRLRLPASDNPSPLEARAEELSAGNDLWIGGTLPDIPAAAMFGGSIRGLAIGVALRDDFRFQVSVDLGTPEMAETLAATARKAVDEAQQKNNLDAKLEIEVVGSTLRIRLVVDQEKLQRLVNDKIAQGVPAPGDLFGAAPPQPAPAQLQPSKPKTVRIFGLDDGPKEIPLSKP